MVKIHVKRRKENPKKKREIIDLHLAEVPLFIKKLYHTFNKPDVCAFCGKPSEFLRTAIDDMTKVHAFHVCRKCLKK